MEKHVLEELLNIVRNAPVFAGDTISHRTANECVRRQWAARDANSDFIPTALGRRVYAAHPAGMTH